MSLLSSLPHLGAPNPPAGAPRLPHPLAQKRSAVSSASSASPAAQTRSRDRWARNRPVRIAGKPPSLRFSARNLPSLLAALALFIALPSAKATVVLDLPLEEMVHNTPLIVRGTVRSATVAWVDQNIETRTRIRSEQVLKAPSEHSGNEALKEIVLVQRKGVIDSIATFIPGDAELEIGEEVVLFLEAHPNGKNEWILTAMAAAKFKVLPGHGPGGVILERDFNGLGLAQRDEDGRIRMSDAAPQARIGLEELREMVAKAAGKNAGEGTDKLQDGRQDKGTMQ